MRPLESFVREAEVAEERPAEVREAGTHATPSAGSDEGLVIQEVAMERFMRYLRRTDPPLVFPERFTAITGPTGAGKTSILDALTFALYKRTTRTDVKTVTIGEVCQSGGFVRVAFDQGGARYEVKRGIARNGQSYLEVTRDGKPLRGTIPELEALLQEVVGLDYEGFRNSTFVRQEEMKQLGADSSSRRLEIFQKLFRLETFERAADRAKERLDALRGEIQGAEGEGVVLREQVATLPAKRAELGTLEEAAANHRTALEEVEARMATLQEEVETLEERHESYLQTRTSREEHEKALAELEARLEDQREALDRLPALRERAAALDAQVAELRALQEEVQTLQGKQQEHALLAKEVEALGARRDDLEASYRSQMGRLEAKVAEEEARLRALSAEMGVEEAFATLREEGSLEERIRRIGQEVAWLAEREDLVRRLEAERATSEEALEAVRAKARGITQETFLYSEIAARIQELQEERKGKEAERAARLQDLDAQRAEAEARRAAVGFGPREEARLRELADRVARLREAEEALLQARQELQRLQDLEAQVREREAERAKLRAALEAEDQALAGWEEQEAAYQEARRALRTLQEERDGASKALYEAEARRQAVAERVRELEGLAERLEEVEGRLEALRERAEVFGLLRDGVFHRKGVVMYAVNRLLPELEIETAKNLDDLTDGRLRRVRLETHEEGGGYGIRILVEGVDGTWHDVAVFSGGERTQINAALRFAIAKELASMPQVGRTYGRMKTLFIDEGDLGSLDSERSRELFVGKLFRMGAFFEKVILITHLGEVAERFPGRIRVTMTPEGESRAEVVA